jgi:hypothetical protein
MPTQKRAFQKRNVLIRAMDNTGNKRPLAQPHLCVLNTTEQNNISTLDYGEKNGNGAKRLWSGIFNFFERMLKY